MATADRPMIIFIDSLHKLTDNYDAKRLVWLPSDLPPHVRIVVSTVADDTTCAVLKQRITIVENKSGDDIHTNHMHGLSSPSLVAHVAPVTRKESEKILDKKLLNMKRTVTDQQRLKFLQAADRCSSTAYIALLVNETVHLSSHVTLNLDEFGSTVRSFATYLFKQAERVHGELFVRRTIGYITAASILVPSSVSNLSGKSAASSKDSGIEEIKCASTCRGLTLNELDDLLSLDDDVMIEVNEFYRPPLCHLPVMLLIHLLDDLHVLWNYSTDIQPHRSSLSNQNFSHQQSDSGKCGGDCLTIYWSHAEVHEAATERYLKQKDKPSFFHKAISEYFLNLWHNVPKPQRGNDAGSNRHIMAQPLFWEKSDNDIIAGAKRNYSYFGGDNSESHSSKKQAQKLHNRLVNYSQKSRRVYNHRRLIQLPVQLLLWQQLEQLKHHCLCNLEFLGAKIAAMSVVEVIKDIQMALNIEPGDADLILLMSTLRQSADALMINPDELASQLVGRLRLIIDQDKPLAPRDPIKYPYIKTLLSHVSMSSVPVLIPSRTCLLEPSGLSCCLLTSHTAPLTALTSSGESLLALTTSVDNTMRLWDLPTGRVLQTIPDIGIDVLQIIFCLDDRLAATSERDCIRLWNIEDESCIMNVNDLSDSAMLTVACGGTMLVAFYHGSLLLRTWNLEHDNLTLSTYHFQSDIESSNSLTTALLAEQSYGSNILCGCK